ncbi:MAG TPA: hypothetical protein VGK59_04080 [Ohtaekwangia sp.]
MITRFSLFILLSTLCGAAVSCSEDMPECPSRMCIVAGGWQLTEVFVDNEQYTEDLSQFRLFLTMPSPTDATTSEFSRVQPSGETDEGTWSLENNEEILRLVPDNNQLLAENWIIESMTPRKMVLVMNRDVDIKEGPAKIEFILEPF